MSDDLKKKKASYMKFLEKKDKDYMSNQLISQEKKGDKCDQLYVECLKEKLK